MGVFLLFDKCRRLVRTAEPSSGDYGATDPLDPFIEKGDPRRAEFFALELRPEVLMRIRPPVWSALVGNSSLSNDDTHLVVDAIEVVRERAQEVASRVSLSAAWSACQERALIHATSQLWPLDPGTPIPPQVTAAFEQATVRMSASIADSKSFASGEARAPVNNILVDLAGQNVPL